MTIVIVASFIVCWTPYYLLGLWYWFQPNMIEEMPEYIHHSLFLFGLLHTCSDPIIYGLYTPCFREDMRMCCHGVTRHKLAQKPRTVALLHFPFTLKCAEGTELQTLHCPPCERIHCTPRKALKLQCNGGITTGICGCCPVCAKTEGETCGGKWDYLGKCDEGLVCTYEESQHMEVTGQDFKGICQAGVTVSATNSSEPWKEPSFTAAAKLRVMLTFCFFLFAGYSNSAVLYSVARKGRKSHIRILILSLTIADLMITFIVMPLDTIWNITVQWYAGEVPCKVLNFLKLFAMYSSALVLVVISLDRHTAILRPFSFTGASHRNRVMLAVAWTASILLASPQLRTVEGVNFTQCIASGSFNERWKETLYNMFTFVTLYVTPLSVMIFCYARILWEIGRQANHGRGQPQILL
ncbi:Gonadotropin-releasing hormone II receptor [Acipenser ruthenus]|uniref:Gonadotropin-releasing hormone II receptor n=1 Tax=Acipenser ruthenus TaxID=7906 RepID=A0A444UX53_ACIRT|nr:Gonadotropin-releasing hormone II receptor [Acipenser ruthenus]